MMEVIKWDVDLKKLFETVLISLLDTTWESEDQLMFETMGMTIEGSTSKNC